jgi:CDP-diacylglycerol--glycerol-3-phosphate 3-phosphatidyltransferase
VFTIPNFLTLLRFIMVPAFLILFFSEFTPLHLVATAIFVLAAVTDWLDGFLARWLQQESQFGQFADPLADKLLSVSLFFALLMRGDLGQQVPIAVPCIVAIALAELGILILSVISLYRGVDLSFSKLGKLKTAIQFTTILLALFRLNVMEIDNLSPAWISRLMGWDGILPWIGAGFVASTVLTVATFAIYLLRYPRHRKALRQARLAARQQARIRRELRRSVRPGRGAGESGAAGDIPPGEEG